MIVALAVAPQPSRLAAEWARLPRIFGDLTACSAVWVSFYDSLDHEPLDKHVCLNSRSDLLILFFLFGPWLVDCCLKELTHLQLLDHTGDYECHEEELLLGVS